MSAAFSIFASDSQSDADATSGAKVLSGWLRIQVTEARKADGQFARFIPWEREIVHTSRVLFGPNTLKS
ncbi:hypothetical protein PTT_02970 [Pyrenophora teres f. teres 0-1]|uniref:Uncharacterized protein n=1 Tax=Pyrenophora teres f. teres (strain 0-1) TaxID=861557 RepID=E3RDT4_PYRTT|nr:hypothetical protein PTT_02970 [Pyrenophora teres f. teres 0-1]